MAAYDDLFDEIGVDMHQAVLDATKSLEARPLVQRFKIDKTDEGDISLKRPSISKVN